MRLRTIGQKYLKNWKCWGAVECHFPTLVVSFNMEGITLELTPSISPASLSLLTGKGKTTDVICELGMRNKAGRVLLSPSPFSLVPPRDKFLLCSSTVLKGWALLLCRRPRPGPTWPVTRRVNLHNSLDYLVTIAIRFKVHSRISLLSSHKGDIFIMHISYFISNWHGKGGAVYWMFFSNPNVYCIVPDIGRDYNFIETLGVISAYSFGH